MFNTDLCCLTPPPFRRPSGLLFIFFLFFQDGLALITFTIEQPGSPHSRPGFPPSLCYICQAHGLSFAWTFTSSSMWPRTSTNRAGNNLEGVILLVNLLTSVHAAQWGGQCGPWPRHLPGAPRCSWAGLSEVFSFSWEHLDSGSKGLDKFQHCSSWFGSLFKSLIWSVKRHSRCSRIFTYRTDWVSIVFPYVLMCTKTSSWLWR